MERRMIFIAVIVILLVAILFMGRGKSAPADKKIKVYGSMGCGWTKKQLEVFGDKCEFVDCTSAQCPSFVTAYPTIERPDGTISVGFSKE